MTFSLELVRELLAGSKTQQQALKQAYELLPTTSCRRRTRCCSLLPEMNLLEALSVIELLVKMSPALRLSLSKRLVRYFFLNAVEISSCPFLAGQDCLIYESRFFGCRVYGLWSQQYYEEQAERSRQAKELSKQQWRSLGVALPQPVVDFQLPYCPYVKTEDDVLVDNHMLLRTSDMIEAISARLRPWHHTFKQHYYSDLSFLLASLAFGFPEAVKLKFEIVSDIIATDDRKRLSEAVNNLPDLLVSLA